jgi:hypothetical protein
VVDLRNSDRKIRKSSHERRGRSAYRRAVGSNMRSAKRWFLDGIKPEQLDQLNTTLEILLDHLQLMQTTRGSKETP